MPKLISLFSLLLITWLTLFPSQVSAATCQESKVDYEPKTFLEGSGGIVLNFTIKDPKVQNNLNGKNVRLRFGIGIGTWQVYDSPPVTVTGSTFSLSLNNPTLKGRGAHSGELQWQPNPSSDFTAFCSEVVYQVGARDRCTIDSSLPNSIPPNSTVTIRFLGIANTNYQLRWGSIGQTIGPTLTTDAAGQGVFRNVIITGNNGDRFNLLIRSLGAENSCSKEVTLTATAPPAPPPGGPIGPVTPHPAALPRGSSLVGAPQTCPDGPSVIQTAIGCVHTEPGLFLKDVLTFVISIAGAIAFLLMLFGVFQMITSAGNADTLKTGQELFTNAIIGLLFIAFSVLLMQIIGVDILKLPGLSR